MQRTKMYIAEPTFVRISIVRLNREIQSDSSMQGGGIIRGKGHLAFVTDAFGNVVVVHQK